MKFSIALSLLVTTEKVRGFSIGQYGSYSRVGSKPLPRTTPFSSGSVKLYGLLDEISGDGYNLMGSSEDATVQRDDFEIFLGELVFSTNDPRVDIMNSYDQAADEAFLVWMKAKAETSNDPEERLALNDLYEMIVDIKKRVELSKLAEERSQREASEKEAKRLSEAEEAADAGRQMSNTDVLRKAAAIGSVKTKEDNVPKTEKKSFFDSDLTPEIRMSYEDTLKKLLPPYKAGETPESIVAMNYDQFDAQFVKVITERAEQGESDSQTLLQALATEQSKRIAQATESLKEVLALGEPMKMEGAIVKLAREGKIDESFLLLLEANETQARDAGANGPAELMKRLRLRAAEEKDKQIASKEIRLIRKLLRAEDSTERETILEDAFTPRENLLVSALQEFYSLTPITSHIISLSRWLALLKMQ